MNQDQIDAGFAHVRSERFLRAHAGQVRDPAFWRGLNPQLTITERPLSVGIDPLRVDAAVAARSARQIVDEGYFHAPSVIPPARLAALRVGAERVVAAGLPSGFTCVDDEFYQAFHGLEALFAPLLGERYLMVLQGLWTDVVPAGDPAYRQWTTVAPHRDTGPRIAITVYFQRRDAARLHPATVELEAPIPFDARLSWIGASLGIADVWKSAGERHA